jgi:hypothetical protein
MFAMVSRGLTLAISQSYSEYGYDAGNNRARNDCLGWHIGLRLWFRQAKNTSKSQACFALAQRHRKFWWMVLGSSAF